MPLLPRHFLQAGDPGVMLHLCGRPGYCLFFDTMSPPYEKCTLIPRRLHSLNPYLVSFTPSSKPIAESGGFAFGLGFTTAQITPVPNR